MRVSGAVVVPESTQSIFKQLEAIMLLNIAIETVLV